MDTKFVEMTVAQRHGGGVAVYVNENLPHEQCWMSDNEIEAIALGLNSSSFLLWSMHICIGA